MAKQPKGGLSLTDMQTAIRSLVAEVSDLKVRLGIKDKSMLTVREAAAHMGLKAGYIRRLVEDGKLRREDNTGRRVVISRQECNLYMNHTRLGRPSKRLSTIKKEVKKQAA